MLKWGIGVGKEKNPEFRREVQNVKRKTYFIAIRQIEKAHQKFQFPAMLNNL